MIQTTSDIYGTQRLFITALRDGEWFTVLRGVNRASDR